jgi:hypothetical protein
MLAPALKKAGLRVCLDVIDFVPGRNLIEEMDRATVRAETERTLQIFLGSDGLAGPAEALVAAGAT